MAASADDKKHEEYKHEEYKHEEHKHEEHKPMCNMRHKSE